MDVSARPAPRTGPPPTSPRAPPSNPTKPHSPRPATPPPPPGLPSHALHTTNHPAYPSNFNHNQSIYHSMDVPSPPLSPSSSVVSSKAHQSFRTYNINDESTLGVSAMGSAMGSQAHQSRHNYLPSGMDSSDVARYQSIIAASRPPPQAPMTPPPPSASGLYARSVDTTVDTDASDANRNSTNRNSTATSIHQTTAYGHPQPQQSHDQPHDQPHEQPSLSRPNAVYSPPPPQTRDLNTDLHRDPHRDRTSHYDPTPATAYYLPTSPRDRPSRSAHHLNSLSQSYSREFRAVDDRIAGYLGRFLRRAKHGKASVEREWKTRNERTSAEVGVQVHSDLGVTRRVGGLEVGVFVHTCVWHPALFVLGQSFVFVGLSNLAAPLFTHVYGLF